MSDLFSYTDKAQRVDSVGVGPRAEIIRPSGGFAGSTVLIETNVSNSRGLLLKDSYFVIEATIDYNKGGLGSYVPLEKFNGGDCNECFSSVSATDGITESTRTPMATDELSSFRFTRSPAAAVISSFGMSLNSTNITNLQNVAEVDGFMTRAMMPKDIKDTYGTLTRLSDESCGQPPASVQKANRKLNVIGGRVENNAGDTSITVTTVVDHNLVDGEKIRLFVTGFSDPAGAASKADVALLQAELTVAGSSGNTFTATLSSATSGALELDVDVPVGFSEDIYPTDFTGFDGSKTKVQFIWRPTGSTLFNYKNAIQGGRFRFTFGMGTAENLKQCLRTCGSFDGVTDAQKLARARVSISDFYFLAHTIGADAITAPPANAVISFSEAELQWRAITSSGNVSNNYTLPIGTSRIAVTCLSENAGSESLDILNARNNFHMGRRIMNLQTHFDGQSIPAMKYQKDDTTNVNAPMELRAVWDSFSNNGHMYRGIPTGDDIKSWYNEPLYIMNYLSAAGSEATQLNVETNISNGSDTLKSLRLLVFSISSKCIIISYDKSGFVSAVSAPQVVNSNPRDD